MPPCVAQDSFVFSIFTELLSHHRSQFRTFSSPQKEASFPLAVTPIFPIHTNPWQPLNYSLSVQSCLFWIFHVNRILQYVIYTVYIYTHIYGVIYLIYILSDIYISFNVVFSRFIHVVAYVNTSFLFMTK